LPGQLAAEGPLQLAILLKGAIAGQVDLLVLLVAQARMLQQDFASGEDHRTALTAVSMDFPLTPRPDPSLDFRRHDRLDDGQTHLGGKSLDVLAQTGGASSSRGKCAVRGKAG
jgi:hypothetical protein